MEFMSFRQPGEDDSDPPSPEPTPLQRTLEKVARTQLASLKETLRHLTIRQQYAIHDELTRSEFRPNEVPAGYENRSTATPS